MGRLLFVDRREGLGEIRLEKCAVRSRLRNPALRSQIVAGILDSAGRLAA